MRQFLLSLSVFICSLLPLRAQQQGFDALRADYPLLMQKFGDELSTQRADYIFAIDVSGTMGKYQDTVVPALEEFFHSLQEGDYVSIIKFGSEAANDVGGAGEIGPGTVKNLTDCAKRIYVKPTTAYEKEKYYNWTDLDNMLHAVAKDMSRIGRNNLKFVFIITDFLHDPSPSRRGQEDWDGVARQLATEQAGNDVYVFALQLPGSGRDLEKVRRVFPKEFEFNHVPITNGEALSLWFTQRKNDILKDKFHAVIARKLAPADLVIVPEMDFNGDLTLGLSWNPNPVYDRLRVSSASFSPSNGLNIESSLPKTAEKGHDSIGAGHLSKEGASLFKPSLKKIEGEVKVEAGFDEPYAKELGSLGFEAPVLQASAPFTKTIFFYPLPFWLFCTIIGLILLYIILVIRAISRNNSALYRINGRFEVTENNVAVTDRKRAAGLDSVSFGRNATFLPVAGCRWGITISVKRYNPFLLFFKAPEYIVRQTSGNGFTANGINWGPHQSPRIAPYSRISVGTHVIRWIQ